jgi:hypothetical protein
MRYGIEIGAAGECGDPRTLGELARIAEDAGWDGIFLEDYIVYYSGAPTYDPWIALTAIALNTQHIRFGTTVTPLARRRPWKVARESVTLDHLSNGRFILGVGLGARDGIDFVNFQEGIDIRKRARKLDEALDVLVGLWSGLPFTYQGQYFQIEEVTFLPKPLQRPRIPIWVGGGFPNKGPMQRAVRYDGAVMYKDSRGKGWLDMTPDDIRSLKSFVEPQRTASTPYAIAVGGRERGPDWGKERAYIHSIAQAGATWWMEEVPQGELAEVRARIERGPLRIDE